MLLSSDEFDKSINLLNCVINSDILKTENKKIHSDMLIRKLIKKSSHQLTGGSKIDSEKSDNKLDSHESSSVSSSSSEYTAYDSYSSKTIDLPSDLFIGDSHTNESHYNLAIDVPIKNNDNDYDEIIDLANNQ